MGIVTDMAITLGHALANTDDLYVLENGDYVKFGSYHASIAAHIYVHKFGKGCIENKDKFINETVEAFKNGN